MDDSENIRDKEKSEEKKAAGCFCTFSFAARIL